MAPEPEDTGSGLPSHPPQKRGKCPPKTGRKGLWMWKDQISSFSEPCWAPSPWPDPAPCSQHPSHGRETAPGRREEVESSGRNAEIRLPSRHFKVINNRRVRRRVASPGVKPGIGECGQRPSTSPCFFAGANPA